MERRKSRLSKVSSSFTLDEDKRPKLGVLPLTIVFVLLFLLVLSGQEAPISPLKHRLFQFWQHVEQEEDSAEAQITDIVFEVITDTESRAVREMGERKREQEMDTLGDNGMSEAIEALSKLLHIGRKASGGQRTQALMGKLSVGSVKQSADDVSERGGMEQIAVQRNKKGKSGLAESVAGVEESSVQAEWAGPQKSSRHWLPPKVNVAGEEPHDAVVQTVQEEADVSSAPIKVLSSSSNLDISTNEADMEEDNTISVSRTVIDQAGTVTSKDAVVQMVQEEADVSSAPVKVLSSNSNLDISTNEAEMEEDNTISASRTVIDQAGAVTSKEQPSESASITGSHNLPPDSHQDVSLGADQQQKVVDSWVQGVQAQQEAIATAGVRPGATRNNDSPWWSDCERGLVYVYELPSVFNQDILRDICTSGKNWCKYMPHNGLGIQLTDTSSLEGANDQSRAGGDLLSLGVPDPSAWFVSPTAHPEPGIEVTYHARLLQHPCRTDDPEKAAAFYLPYYGGLDMVWRMEQQETVREGPHKFVEWLKQQPYFQRSGGHDHFIAVGPPIHLFKRKAGMAGSDLFALPEMRNVTKFSRLRDVWDDTSVGVPYPVAFHPSTDAQVVAWQEHVRSLKRRRLVSLVASRGRSKGKGDDAMLHFNIRESLFQECEGWSRCRLVDCASKRVCESDGKILQHYGASDFCLQPPGNDPTRKGVFDAILMGCIPVFFHTDSAHQLLLVHYPRDWERYSVFIKPDDIASKKTTIQKILRQYSRKQIEEMRRVVIEEVLPATLVANPENYGLRTVKDAVDRALEGVLTKVERWKAGRTHLFPTRWNFEHDDDHKSFWNSLEPLGKVQVQ